MKKKPARKLTKDPVKQTKTAKKHYNKGALGAGMAYAILGMLVILAAGTTMIGSIVPTGKGEGGQPVVIITKAPEAPKNNLQLETFPGVTYTPTPTPTPTPTETPPPPPPNNGGGSGGGGGNSAPDRGGGGGSSSGGPGIGYLPVQFGKFLLAITGLSR